MDDIHEDIVGRHDDGEHFEIALTYNVTDCFDEHIGYGVEPLMHLHCNVDWVLNFLKEISKNRVQIFKTSATKLISLMLLVNFFENLMESIHIIMNPFFILLITNEQL